MLTEEVKKEVSGVDDLANSHGTLILAVMKRNIVRQQAQETRDEFYKKVESISNTSELSGSAQFCS